MRIVKGFTYIELLITLSIIAVLFVPIMQLFSHSLGAIGISRDIITATNLAKWEMERTKNLKITNERLKGMAVSLYPPLESPPFTMNGIGWRIKREFIEQAGPLQVKVSVFRDGHLDEPLITLVTLREDTTWQKVQAAR